MSSNSNSNYYNHGRSSRSSPPGVDPHSGLSYPDQGRRTTLPPLTIAFLTSDSPGLSLYSTSTHLNSTFTSLAQCPPITKIHHTLRNLVLPPYHTSSLQAIVRDYGRYQTPSTSSNPDVKTRLPNSKRSIHTLILRIMRLRIQDIKAVSSTTLTTVEFRRTLGRTCPRLWRSRSRSRRETRGGRDRSII